MKYKAIFFDRDGTLTYFTKEKELWRDNIISEWSERKYFTSFTASSLVGAGKPSPIIFNAALEAQGVLALESLYVVDCKREADGAREQGFTSFLIDRSGE